MMLDLDFSECRPVKVVRNRTPLREPAVPWVRRGQSKLICTPLLRACVVAGWGCPAAPCSCRGGRRGRARWKLHVAFTPSDVSLLLTPERPGSSRCRCPRCLCGQIPGHTCPSSKLSARGRNLLPKPSPPGESRARRRPKVWLHLAPRTAAALPWRPAGPGGG